MTRPLYETAITQFDDEIDPFIEILRLESAKSLIEVGSRFGGSLWRIANGVPSLTRVVAVDSGSGMGGNKPGAQESLQKCVRRLCERGLNARLVVGDSHLPEIINQATSLGPYDAAFIDGDHSLEGITLDWFHYGRHTKVCGFHDIAWERPVPYEGKLVDCKAFWDVIKLRHRSETFVHKGGNMGVGVCWPKQRPA